MKKLLFFFGILLLLSSCQHKNEFDLIDFNPISNYDCDTDTLDHLIDLSKAIVNGVVIPSEGGNELYYVVKFKLKNTSAEPRTYSYKVYYQNESYAFDLTQEEGSSILKNEKANNNFYGSWNSHNMGFHTTQIIPNDKQYYEIIDTIKIIGNPRNEPEYFGGKQTNPVVSKREFDQTVNRIKESEEWMEKIRAKAKKNNIDVDQQIKMDVDWSIKYDMQKGDQNNRWKRNPRIGVYSFMIVVTEEKNLNEIPYYYQDVSMKDTLSGSYQNPYYYFLHNLDYKSKYIAFVAEKKIKATVKVDFTQGIFTNSSMSSDSSDRQYMNEFCNDTDSLFYSAQIEQYYHHINRDSPLRNIPMAYDVVDGTYTRDDYVRNASSYNDSDLINDYFRITDYPGRTLGFDSLQNAIMLKNPGNLDAEKYRKENVGVKTRTGFTYGTYRAKIKFPKILSDDFVWNGITCAFWLIYQEGDWNTRSNCNSGFNPKLISSKERKQSTAYSEIDIEIVKTSKFWPKTSYGDAFCPKDTALNKNVIVTCTNWDLACHDPDSFNCGVRRINYENSPFDLHRWDDDYRALSSKFEYPHDDVMGRTIYYEIEWQPEYIIWRIGVDKDHMIVIGYMDDKSTSIPDNQMQIIVTQEFHEAVWWPLTPFKQDLIPYPLNDIEGYIYEIEID